MVSDADDNDDFATGHTEAVEFEHKPAKPVATSPHALNPHAWTRPGKLFHDIQI